MRTGRQRRQTPQPIQFRRATRPTQPEPWTSAGGVVLQRRRDGALDVALVGRRRPVRWALPKGTRRPDESLERTAAREVQEETGLVVRLVLPIGQIHYSFRLAGVPYDKTVDFYLMQPMGGDISEHDDEYEYVPWFSVDQALRQMAYPNEAQLVERAIGIADAGSLFGNTAVSVG